MNLQLRIVASVPVADPAEEYFASLAAAAQRALQADEVTRDEAWALCEYLDAADAGALAMVRAVYRQAVGALGEFLADRDNVETARWLAGRSWAAETLLKMVADVPLPRRMLRAA